MTAKRFGVAMAICIVAGCGRDQHDGAVDNVQTAAPSKVEAKGVAIDPPAGWAARAQGAWTVHQAPDARAHLAFAKLGAAEAVPAKVAEAIAAMGGADPRTSDEQAITIGPDKLPARAASGACRFGADDGRMQYAVVDAGEGERMLLVFAAAKDAPEGAQRTAFASIASMRRK